MKGILVVSHPRSGTHFTIDSIRGNFVDIEFQVHPRGAGLSPESLILSHGEVLRQQFLDQVTQTGETIGIFKSHMLPEDFEAAIQDRILPTSVREILRTIYEEFRILYVRRDGRDVMISHYHYINRGGGILFLGERNRHLSTSLSEFIRTPNDSILPVRTFENFDRNRASYWAHHVESWMCQDRISQVSYEALSGKWEPTMQSVARDLKLEERLKDQLERPVLPQGGIGGRLVKKLKRLSSERDEKISTAKLPYKGKVGEWTREFSESDVAFVQREAGAVAARVGYDFGA